MKLLEIENIIIREDEKYISFPKIIEKEIEYDEHEEEPKEEVEHEVTDEDNEEEFVPEIEEEPILEDNVVTEYNGIVFDNFYILCENPTCNTAINLPKALLHNDTVALCIG